MIQAAGDFARSLDMRTLFIVASVVIAFSGGVLLVARGHDSNATALSFWGTAMLLGAVGIVLIALEAKAGPMAGLFGTAAILLGTALSWTGARVFAGRRPVLSLLLGGPLAWLLLRLMLPEYGNAWTPGVLALGLGSAFTVATAAALWRVRSESLRTRRFAIAILMFHAAVYVGRAALMLLVPDWATSRPVEVVLVFEALLHTIGMAFLLLALMKERAELRATMQLRNLAMHDGLTGLTNRRCFDEALEAEFRRAGRSRQPLALLMIDVDHFKLFNDTYGHQSGDDALRAVADALATTVHRPGDLVARYGGEEFTVLLPGTSEPGAITLADTVHAALVRLSLAHAGSPHGQVTVSIGVAALEPRNRLTRSDNLLRAADLAMYAAKAEGRNRTSRASELLGLAPQVDTA